jgi:hypothetical protein
MMPFPVNTLLSNNQLIYVYPGTLDAISLDTIKDGDMIVLVRNGLKKIYKYNTYNMVLSAVINTYGLDMDEVIDPDVPLCNSVIGIDAIQYYTAKLITEDIVVPNSALVAETYRGV